MGLVNYIKTLWTTTTTFNPSRMNNLENGIESCANAINDIAEADKDMITEVKMNGTSIKGVNGVADLGSVVTSVQSVTGGSAYNPEKPYIVGDLAINFNTLYRCKVACKGIEPPNDTYWEKVDLATLNNNLVNIANATFGTISASKTLTISATNRQFFGILIVGGASASRTNAYVLYLTSSNALVMPLSDNGSQLATSSSANNVYVKNNASYSVGYSIIANKDMLDSISVSID